MSDEFVRVGVIGATGYAGLELLRILATHPCVRVTYAASSHGEDATVAASLPYLSGFESLKMDAYDEDRCVEACDAVFVALPSGASGQIALALHRRGKTVIDLSGDLRLPSDMYEKWYRKPALVPRPDQVGAVYGLTEWCRSAVRDATLIANPGCYATGALLALLPVVRAGWNQPATPIVIDAKSGVSGAGRKPQQNSSFAELQENFYAYKVGGHQHTPEIAQALGCSPDGNVVLTTQLLPVVRGIFVSAYVPMKTSVSAKDVMALYEDAYRGEPFVGVCADKVWPEMKHVRGSNRCHIGLHMHKEAGVLQVFSVIDNLQKGAAGQAIQNFNLMYGFAETNGLASIPLVP